MRQKKLFIPLLIVTVAVFTSVNIYFLFFFNFNNKVLPNDTDKNDYLITENMQLSYAQSNNVYPIIRPVPLPLETRIDEHLKKFRQKAETIAGKFPESFIISADTEEKVCALTFDDGPDRESTERIIKILNSHNIKGTFFFIGNQLKTAYYIVQIAMEKGHLIANHSWSHQRPTDISTLDLLHEVSLANSKLKQFGVLPPLFRPPYGLVTEEQMDRLNQLGYKTIAWSIDSMDWYFNDPDKIYKCVVDAIHPGAIILMHSAGGRDNRNATVEALPRIIEDLKSKGYKFVTVEELLTLY